MAATVSDVPKMGIEMMLERIMGAMEKQVRELNCLLNGWDCGSTLPVAIAGPQSDAPSWWQ